MSDVKVELPSGLAVLARLPRDVVVALAGPATLGAVLDALEADHPILRGTLRDTVSLRRRPFIRFFACQQDFSHCAMETPLPEAVTRGRRRCWWWERLLEAKAADGWAFHPASASPIQSSARRP